MHRDLKPKNLGLMADGRLVVFDFGVAKLLRRGDATDAERGIAMTGVVGSLRYMAPEVALSKPYNHKSECYSYAIVVWEMTALRRPFEGVTPETFEQRVCAAGERPALNEKKWPPALCSLLARCWAHDFGGRPEFREIADVMMSVVADDSQPGKPPRPASTQEQRRGSGGGASNAEIAITLPPPRDATSPARAAAPAPPAAFMPFV